MNNQHVYICFLESPHKTSRKWNECMWVIGFIALFALKIKKKGLFIYFCVIKLPYILTSSLIFFSFFFSFLLIVQVLFCFIHILKNDGRSPCYWLQRLVDSCLFARRIPLCKYINGDQRKMSYLLVIFFYHSLKLLNKPLPRLVRSALMSFKERMTVSLSLSVLVPFMIPKLPKNTVSIFIYLRL